MSTQHHQVIVAGAGPAGSTAARYLAEHGKDVLLLDKCGFPRHKPCGGGIPQRTGALLGMDLTTVRAGHVSHVCLAGGLFGKQFSLPLEHECHVVDRTRFDNHLLQEAQKAGATFIPNCGVCDATHSGEAFLVTTTRGVFSAADLCICDGVYSPTGRALGIRGNPLGFCLEALVPMRDSLPEEERHRATFHLTCVRRGYGWSFPREDAFAVGIGGAFSHAPALRHALQRLVESLPELRGSPLTQLHGGMIPDFGTGRDTYAPQGAYLCGDAAGLVDPLTGEGIFYAIQSALLAAEAIMQKNPATYDNALQTQMLPELRIAAHYARRFRALPPLLFRIGMRSKRFRAYAEEFIRLLAGETSYQEMYTRMHAGKTFAE